MADYCCCPGDDKTTQRSSDAELWRLRLEDLSCGQPRLMRKRTRDRWEEQDESEEDEERDEDEEQEENEEREEQEEPLGRYSSIERSTLVLAASTSFLVAEEVVGGKTRNPAMEQPRLNWQKTFRRKCRMDKRTFNELMGILRPIECDPKFAYFRRKLGNVPVQTVVAVACAGAIYLSLLGVGGISKTTRLDCLQQLVDVILRKSVHVGPMAALLEEHRDVAGELAALRLKRAKLETKIAIMRKEALVREEYTSVRSALEAEKRRSPLDEEFIAILKLQADAAWKAVVEIGT